VPARKTSQKQSHEDRLRGSVSAIQLFQDSHIHQRYVAYFFFVVFFAFFAGAFFVAITHHPLPFQGLRNEMGKMMPLHTAPLRLPVI
jgi:hypothetical protein